MVNPALDFIDLLGSTLKKYQDALGPLYTPTLFLLGSLVFLFVVTSIIVFPLIIFSADKYAILFQFFLLLVYFVLLQAIQFRVLERFVYSLCLTVIFAAAPAALDAELQYAAIQTSIPELAAIAYPKYHFFLFGLMRGIGNVAWALPVLFWFYTFYPRMAERGEEAISTGLRQSVRTALALQVLAIVLICWQDDIFGRFLASTEGAMPLVKRHVTSSQLGYFVFCSLYLFLGLVALLAVHLYAARSDVRVLSIVVGGLVLVQMCFFIAKGNVRSLNEYYPAARSTRIQAYEARSGGGKKVVFTSPFFEDLGSNALANRRLFLSCQGGPMGKFTYAMSPMAKFAEEFAEVDPWEIKHTRRSVLFCQSG